MVNVPHTQRVQTSENAKKLCHPSKFYFIRFELKNLHCKAL